LQRPPGAITLTVLTRYLALELGGRRITSTAPFALAYADIPALVKTRQPGREVQDAAAVGEQPRSFWVSRKGPLT
jgi:hypothetical protein